MQSKIYILLLLAVSVFFTFSCEKSTLSNDEGFDFYQIKFGENLYGVVENNNVNDDIVLIFINDYNNIEPLTNVDVLFKELQKKYKLLFFEYYLELSPNCIIINENTKYNTNRNALVLNELVKITKAKNSNTKIFLISQGYGSLISHKYLNSYADESEINGWINVNGLHNFLGVATENIDTILNNYIALNEEKDKNWIKREIDFYENIEFNDDFYPFKSLMEDLKVNFDFINDRSTNKKIYKRSMFSHFANLSLHHRIPESYEFPYIEHNNIDDSEELTFINIPTIICAGRQNYFITPYRNLQTYNKLGTYEMDKYIEYFENSAHFPFIEEEEKFNLHISEFIDKYK